MENSFVHYSLRTLNKLSYRYEFFAWIKNRLRSVKYFFFGKSGLAEVLEQIIRARSGAPVEMVFDVGAAVGDKTIIFLNSFPKATVYSFEPQKEGLATLKERTAQYADRVKAFGVGFFSKNDSAPLYISKYRDSSSMLQVGTGGDEDMNVIETRTIPVVTMDSFIEKNHILHIDFIKIDVEGAEKDVLEGGRETFQNKIGNIFIEISPSYKSLNSRDFADIFQFFYETGFTFVGCYGDYFFSKDKDVLTYLFKK